VKLEDQPTLLTAPPPDLLTLLRSIPLPSLTSPPTLVISSTPPPTQISTIPLAALLLEYPIAYVPTSPDQTLFLSHVPLDVYEFVLVFVHPCGDGRSAGDSRSDQGWNRHTLLKFSCPRGLDPPIEKGKLVGNLESHFQVRLQEAGLNGIVLLGVDHHAQTFDRVAL